MNVRIVVDFKNIKIVSIPQIIKELLVLYGDMDVDIYLANAEDVIEEVVRKNEI